MNDLDPGSHRFRLKQIDFDGAFEYSSVVEAAVTVPDRFLIEPAYPNPFNPTTTLRFAVAAELRVRNLGDAMQELAGMGYALIGLDATAERALGPAIAAAAGQPLGLVFGSEGVGLRQRTRGLCTALARISAASEFGSLNVSNAAAVALFTASESAQNAKIPG